jgi:serine/threonine protein kinase
METYCTRPTCSRPHNLFADLDTTTLKTVQQKFCTTCGMPQILVGRYLPTRLLGKGGFGAAFLAIDRYTPAMRQCVVKLFQPAGDLSANQLKIAQELFEREAEVLEQLGNRHPQIPDLLAFFELSVPGRTPGKTEQFFYLVQEFIDGQNLEEELAQKGTFSQSEVLEVLIEILKILKFVHENGSIHRDIKPSNIMRDRAGKLFLLDFGAVKQVTAASSGQGAQSSTGIYSMGFAPPEQMAGNVVYPATDLYALGVTCITLLTGKQPSELYDAYSNTWKWRSFMQVHQRIGDVLDKMLKASASDRFASAQDALEALAQGKGSAAAPPTPVPAAPAASPRPPVTPSPVTQPPTMTQPPAMTPSPAAAPVSRTPPPAQSFSTLDLVSGAAFTGFEGGLLAIALLSLVGTTLVSAGFWMVLVLALVVAQVSRVIEKFDLVIIAGISAVIMIVASPLRSLAILANLGNPIVAMLVIAGVVALGAIAVAIVFRLIYKILSMLL